MSTGTNSNTAVCGIILHPAGHTRSPAMHSAAFAACGMDATYRAFDIPPSELAGAIDRMRRLEWRQLAVSLPHKQTVIEHVDYVSEVARTIGAVNTVTRRENGQLEGENTDWLGALLALRKEIEPQGRRAVILGAGGAARAVAYALVQEGADVWVLNRTESRAAELKHSLGTLGSGTLAELGDLNPEIIVNTTSVGLRSDASPVVPDALPNGCVVMDSVYEPERTRLLKDADARGCRPLGGKWMLVYQAAEQFRLWTNRVAPLSIMSQAFDEAGHK